MPSLWKRDGGLISAADARAVRRTRPRAGRHVPKAAAMPGKSWQRSWSDPLHPRQRPRGVLTKLPTLSHARDSKQIQAALVPHLGGGVGGCSARLVPNGRAMGVLARSVAGGIKGKTAASATIALTLASSFAPGATGFSFCSLALAEAISPAKLAGMLAVEGLLDGHRNAAGCVACSHATFRPMQCFGAWPTDRPQSRRARAPRRRGRACGARRKG